MDTNNDDLEVTSGAATPQMTADAGAAQAFSRRWAGRLLHDHSTNSWLEFDGVRWARDETGRIMQHGLEVSNFMLGEATALLSRAAIERDARTQRELKQQSDLAGAAAVQLHKKPRLDAMIQLAASDPRIATTRSAFDPDDMILGVHNGVIELRSGAARRARPEDMVTRQAGAAFYPDAACPTWDTFLNRVQPDPEVRRWLQRWAGYCLTGDTSQQQLTVFHGAGANGKTVFSETVKTLLGTYAVTADFSSFIAREQKGDSIRNDLARLDKVRLVVASEGAEGARLDEDLVKCVTGGEKITARFLHREFFEFRPRFKLLLVTNHRPTIVGTDPGIWRRVVLVPWPVTIPRCEQDRGLAARLEHELPGILNWALSGLAEFQRGGLDDLPATIAVANEMYRKDSDDIGAWIEDACDLGAALRASANAIYASYAAWASASGHRAMSARALGDRLRGRGLAQCRMPDARGSRGWLGIAPRSPSDVRLD